jgi:hypothetical protein
MADFFYFDDFSEQVLKGTHDLDGTHTLKVYLSNATPSASGDAVKSDLAEISGGNGYTGGGHSTTPTLTESSGTAKLACTDVTITASGGAVGPFRYAVLYNDTSASDNLIGCWDYNSSISLASGESFTIDFDDSNGVFTLAKAP